ncbi:hypothetical protein UA17_01738 [Burkholderia multivorans]|uniref:hypothetical protein n=1 Tax=Burkholderia multivorans TaxID=87883 RepID=UPI0009E0CEEA|nr:hypothetical protein [Burkholderia multivorans]SAK19112.1 hypothetical protein UA17_01738 [Burkholderia multivorans]
MNDQQHSSADALTDEFVKRAFYAADCGTWYEMYPSAAMDVAREILAASPVEQPEQDDGVPECNGSHDAGQIAAGDAECTACAGEHPAPSPADERATLAKLRAEMFDWLASCTKEHIDGKIEFINRVTEGFAAIYARSAASPAAEVAQWQSRLKDRSSPVVDHWVNISPDGAKTLMEKYSDVYEVRALYTAPRSPAVAAEAVADERAAFEKVFPMPADCQRIGSGPTAGYAPTEYGAWEAHDFIRRWEGWKARAAASPAAAIPKRGDDEDA